MSVDPKRVLVGTNPTELLDALNDGEQVLILNRGTVSIYAGSAYVDGPSTGVPIAPLGSLTVPTDRAWWALADAAAGTTPQAVYVVPGGTAYSPAPSEIALQIATSNLAAQIGAAVPVPPSAAAIGIAVGGSVPVPPSAAAIGAAVPVPPSVVGLSPGTSVLSTTPSSSLGSASASGTITVTPSPNALSLRLDLIGQSREVTVSGQQTGIVYLPSGTLIAAGAPLIFAVNEAQDTGYLVAFTGYLSPVLGATVTVSQRIDDHTGGVFGSTESVQLSPVGVLPNVPGLKYAAAGIAAAGAVNITPNFNRGRLRLWAIDLETTASNLADVVDGAGVVMALLRSAGVGSHKWAAMPAGVMVGNNLLTLNQSGTGASNATAYYDVV